MPPKLSLAAKHDNCFLFTSHYLINQANLCTFLEYNLESDAGNTGQAYESVCVLYCHKCIKRIQGKNIYVQSFPIGFIKLLLYHNGLKMD